MHVALITPGWPLGYPNGIVTYAHHLRNGLMKQGHLVSIFSFAVDGPCDTSGVYHIEPPNQASWRKLLKRLFTGGTDCIGEVPRWIADALLRVHATRPIDVVEMEESFGWCAEVQAMIPFRVVVKLHGPAFLTNVEHALLRPVIQAKIVAEGEALRHMEFVTSPSSTALTSTRLKYNLGLNWGRVIPNPIMVPAGTPKWHREDCDPNLLLFVGRFDRIKGGDIVVSVFARLAIERPELRLIFVGPDVGIEMENGQHVGFHEYLKQAVPYPCRDRVEFRGRLEQAEILELRCKAAITLVCSRWENQPNTALEALLQCCPVVGVDAGGLSEVIRSGETGILALAEDIDDLCQKIGWALDHPGKLAEFGVLGREYVLRIHDPETVAALTQDYYHQSL